ncbi:transcriptional regulator [Streptomyces aidingensis]|uniref:Tetratricopeptide repeat-containing protein n=1 Tax=Streptomyces aidingensis TaxID=910347 RepID=A0A1I1LZK8_9ACTN|nr:transcriptional regulator [Streptomyces aidingensis]SFC78286.1 hypothetical protein SAMN05421773_10623 [Streptomyces aidingensis]
MATRTPNHALARVIEEAGLTYAQVASAVNRAAAQAGMTLHYTQPSVSQWVKGTLPRETVRPFILEVLTRRLGRPITSSEVGFPSGLVAPHTRRQDVVEGLVELGVADIARRGVINAGLFSVAMSIPDWPDVVGRTKAVRAGRVQRVGMAEVEVVRAMTQKISGLDDEFGGRHARPMAVGFLIGSVGPYLVASATLEVRKAMLAATADLCYLIGYMAVDEGLHGLAQHYYVKALELAGAAEDHLTYCTTLRGMSVQAVDLGHSAQALRLADAAAAASPAAGPRKRGFLAGQQAHAYAAMGDRRAAMRYLREAEVALEKAESRPGFGGYDPSTLAYHEGQVRYEMGDLPGSVAAFKLCDQLRDDVYRRTRVRQNAFLAERQLAVGLLEEACATWGSVLDEYPLVNSGRADEKVAIMKASLRPYLGHRAARGLYERAQAATAPPSPGAT